MLMKYKRSCTLLSKSGNSRPKTIDVENGEHILGFIMLATFFLVLGIQNSFRTSSGGFNKKCQETLTRTGVFRDYSPQGQPTLSVLSISRVLLTSLLGDYIVTTFQRRRSLS